MAKGTGKAAEELIWGETPEEFATYVSHLESSNLRAIVEKRVATAILRLPEVLDEEDWQEVRKRMAPVENEELAHLDHYVRMVDEYNARHDEVVQSDILPIMKKYEEKLDKQLTAYAEKSDGVKLYFEGIQKAVKREGKRIAADLDLGLDKKTLDNLLEGLSINLARMSNSLGGGILTVLRGAACQQRFYGELDKWKAKHPKDILATHDAEITAREKRIQEILGKYFQRGECGDDCGSCGGSCG